MSFTLDIGGREALGFFREVSGLDPETEIVEADAAADAPAPGASEKAGRGEPVGATISGEVAERHHVSWLEIASLRPR